MEKLKEKEELIFDGIKNVSYKNKYQKTPSRNIII